MILTYMQSITIIVKKIANSMVIYIYIYIYVYIIYIYALYSAMYDVRSMNIKKIYDRIYS